MPRIEEPRLKADLKAGKLANVYFLFGEEDYLIKLYTEKIIDAAIGDGDREMNFAKFTGTPRCDELSDHTESVPFFAEHKCVLINNLEPESMDTAELNAYVKFLSDIPKTTVLVISEQSVEIDAKKPKAKTKKIMSAIEAAGCVCEMKYMSAAMIAAMAEKKAARAGCVLSHENGVYLAELCGLSLTNVSKETEKLCAYKGSGEITREDIDRLTAKIIDTGVYTLAAALFEGKTAQAFRILDDLYAQQIDSINIMSALSGHFVDLYRAKLGRIMKKNSSDTAELFRYPPNRSFIMRKAFGAASGLSERYLGDCIAILYRTNLELNSSKADKRMLIEKALTEISVLPKE